MAKETPSLSSFPFSGGHKKRKGREKGEEGRGKREEKMSVSHFSFFLYVLLESKWDWGKERRGGGKKKGEGRDGDVEEPSPPPPITSTWKKREWKGEIAEYISTHLSSYLFTCGLKTAEEKGKKRKRGRGR